MSETTNGTTKPATIVRDEKRRETASLEGETLVPPQVYNMAPEGEHGAAVDAVARAVAEVPNAIDFPAIRGRDADDFGALTVTFRPNKMPVVGEDGLEGWKPPYMAEEQFCEALRDELPDGWDFEPERRGRLVLFET